MLVDRYHINQDTVMTIGEFSILWCRFESVFFESKVTGQGLTKYAENIKSDERMNPYYEVLKKKSIEYLRKIDEETISARIYSS